MQKEGNLFATKRANCYGKKGNNNARKKKKTWPNSCGWTLVQALPPVGSVKTMDEAKSLDILPVPLTDP